MASRARVRYRGSSVRRHHWRGDSGTGRRSSGSAPREMRQAGQGMRARSHGRWACRGSDRQASPEVCRHPLFGSGSTHPRPSGRAS